jgi:hypothetical protein
MHTLVSAVVLLKSCTVAILKHIEPIYLKITFALPPMCLIYTASFHSQTNFLLYGIAIDFFLHLILTTRSYPSRRTLLRHLLAITNLVKFIQGRHPNRYL